jgi:CDP-6-deoxy-D-xylo-4-hexulose-3-dehydrase
MGNRTMKQEELQRKIRNMVRSYFSIPAEDFVPGETPISLNVPTYSWEEVNEVLDSLLSTYVTMGEKVKKFEELFANYIGLKNSIMVNSGSSANLLALSILSNPALKKCIRRVDEIITPAVTWSTTVFPIVNIGAVPVLVDVNLETLNAEPVEIRKAITKRTKAIMPVHLLGNPCDMKEIMEIAEDNDLFVIEDSCEAHGAELEGKKVGSFGHLSTFSFFFSHHISTIEGGMVLTNVDEYAELGRVLRAHGWIRDMVGRDKVKEKYDQIDDRFLFVNLGYNLRPTDLQGAFGIHQIGKLEKFIEIRRKNAEYWNSKLKDYSDYIMLHEEREGTRHVWFGYPITVKADAPFTRDEFVRYLKEKRIETRPIMAGNINEQPVSSVFKHRKIGNLPNSKVIMRQSLFWGNHQGIGEKEREYIVDCVSRFIIEKSKT